MRQFDRDMQAELQSHIEHRADDLVKTGLTREEALRRARVEFGAVEAYKEQLREDRFLATWRAQPSLLWRETRLAVRRLRQAPLFVAFAVTSLAIGLGVTTAAYTIIQSIVWPEMGIADTDRVALVATKRGLSWRAVMSLGEFDELRRQQTSFATLAGSASKYFYLNDETTAVGARGEVVTGNYFQALGVSAAMGRTLQPADDDPGAPDVIVISDYLWRIKLGEDPNVVGRVVRMGGRPAEIVGVMPRDFPGLSRLNATRRTDVWASWNTSPVVDHQVVVKTAGADKQNSTTTALTQSVTVIGRLRQDASIDAAAVEIATAGSRFDSMWPRYSETANGKAPAPRNWTAATFDAVRQRGLAEGTGIAAAIVMVFALVLAVACTNLTNLTLARGSARQTELTVRRALGASRSRLVRELTIESLLVGVTGGLAAVLTARWLIAFVANEISLFGTTLAEMFDPRLDYSSYVFGAGAVISSFVVIGLLPAIRLTRDEASASLARSTSPNAARWRGQRSLIRAQIAVSMLLMLTAAFCIAVVVRGTQHDTGLDLEQIVIAHMGFAELSRDPVRGQAAADAVLQELAAEPLLERAAVTSGLPSASATFATVAPEDRPEQLQKSKLYVLAAASPGLTEVMGIPLLSGRAFDHRDAPGSPAVAVVSASLAREVFGTTEVVGQRMAIDVHSQSPSRTSRSVAGKLASLSTVSGRSPGPNEAEVHDLRILSIVGVTADTQVEWGRVDGGVVYVPLAQLYEPPARIVARRAAGATEQDALMALRNAVRRAGRDFAITGSGTGEQVLAPERAAMRVMSGLTTALGGFAVALTMIGLYGVLSHVVVRRTREMCLRLALGATPDQLLRMVIRDGLRPVISGAAIGVVLGIPIRIAAHDALDEFLTIEPLLFAVVTLGFVGFGAIACYWPARRASTVDPNVALKEL